MILTRKRIDWPQLQGHIFETAMGARFAVVKVTARNITIRPERGTRNYAISIQNELERVLDDYVAGRFFPSPTQLLGIGVRKVQTSYAWGILHELLQQGVAERGPVRVRKQDFPGRWQIVELSELGKDYFAESDEPPFIQMHTTKHERLYGEYHFGLSNGNLYGEVREFGGERVLLFSYEGSDEMDPVCGAGWLQLKEKNRLEGEFLEDYGRCLALRRLRSTKR